MSVLNVGDPRLVPSAVATVLGLGVRTEDPLPGLVAGLRDKRMLLLLDTCEHVIDAAADLAATLLSGAPGVNILATSREPLRVPGESEYRLGPLSSPPRSSKLTAAEAAAFPAVQLFVERVSAIVEDFELTDANAPLVVEICRRLDGLPLAIEFAAPGVAAVGVEGLAAHLDDSLRMLGARRRAAMPRHRTMRAVADWSYGLLSGDEQLFFRALGIFIGGFTVAAAAAVAPIPANTRIDAIDLLADLVAKSLVAADVTGANPRFRLLDTTRAYAIEKLEESGERKRLARRHAEYYRSLFERAEGEAVARPADQWLADYAREIDNLRAALDWAFAPDGDVSIGVAVTNAAVPLWMRLSLLEECRSRAKEAIGALGTSGCQDPREEMRLHAVLGVSTPDVPEMGAAFTKVLDIAERLGDAEYQLRALRGLFGHNAASGRYRAALQSAQKFHDLATRGSDLNDRLFGERIIGAAKHFLGDHVSARRHLAHVLAQDGVSDRERDVIRLQDVVRFATDLRVSTLVVLARLLWLQGFADQAVRTAEMSIKEAQATGDALSVCYALAMAACPVALWVGNLTAAAHYAGTLSDHSREHSLALWSASGSRFQKIVILKAGDLDEKSQQLHVGLDEIAEPNLSFRSLTGLSELAEALTQAGRITEGFAMVEAAIKQSEAGWLTPELLRLKGDLFLLQGTPTIEKPEELFRRALDEARGQGALSWELRAATSLARLLHTQGRPADAIACLQPIYDRFTEGFGTADLIAAKQLLDELGDAGRH
jgi:predicted ATPase